MAVRLLRPYIGGTKSIIRTDNHALRAILSFADATGKRTGWCLQLSEFYFKVIHKGGVKQQVADALSRLSTSGADDIDIGDAIQVLAVQKQSRKEKRQLPCSSQNFDYIAATSEPYPIMTAKADDVGLSAIAEFMIAQSQDTLCHQMR